MPVRVFVATVIAALLAGLMPAAAQIHPTPPGWQIERAVLLSRHGVRAPTQPNSELDKHTASAWPAWPVGPGILSPRGEELMRLMGSYYRVLYGGRGLVQADDCPPAGTVQAWTDIDQRTRASGAAILGGMYPRCANLALRNQADFTVPDPLFRPTPTASCPMDPAATRKAVTARIGGSFASTQRDYAPQIAMMQSVLCPGGTTKTAAGGTASGGGQCGEAGMASSIETGRDGRTWIKGPIGFGSMAAEAFLMQSAEGMPKDQVAWGRLAGDPSLMELMSLHGLDLDLTERTPAIARARGANMLNQIAATLEFGHKFPGAQPVGFPVRLGLLVGHQGNIAQVAALLGLTWHIPGFVADEPSPGGALAFELFRDGAGRRYVRVNYYAQTLDEMRRKAGLNYRDPPGMVSIALPACTAEAQDNACPLPRFLEIAKAAIDPGCLTAQTP